MSIDPSAVGSKSEPAERSWTSKDALLYAVGVGAGTEELAFTTENSQGIDQQVLPTFATIIGGGGRGMRSIGQFNPGMLVDGGRILEFSSPIPPEGTVRTVSTITGIWDKGSGAVVERESESVDAETGEPRFVMKAWQFIRGEGGFGGERGPSGPRNVPPERAPDHEVTYHTLPQQALIYRLSGDRNPLHSDPEFAKRAGFERPILHGLCTYGFTGRALLHALCDSDPARFKSMEGRFSRPMYPGEALTVRIWVDGTEAVYVTESERGDVVVDQGRCTFTK